MYNLRWRHPKSGSVGKKPYEQTLDLGVDQWTITGHYQNSYIYTPSPRLGGSHGHHQNQQGCHAGTFDLGDVPYPRLSETRLVGVVLQVHGLDGDVCGVETQCALADPRLEPGLVQDSVCQPHADLAHLQQCQCQQYGGQSSQRRVVGSQFQQYQGRTTIL